MKKWFTVLLLIVMAFSLTACGKHKEEIETMISQMQAQMESLSSDAEEMYGEGAITKEVYSQAMTLVMKFNDNKNSFEELKSKAGYGNDSKIFDELKECQKEFETLRADFDAVYASYDGVKEEIVALQNEVIAFEEYVNSALKAGRIDNSVVTRYNEICEEIERYTTMLFPSGGVVENINALKSELAVMASRCAAPNDVVDEFVAEPITEAVTAEAEKADTSKTPLTIDELINSYVQLQNEVSKKVERGTMTDDEYKHVVELGNTLNAIKESGDSAKMNEVKAELHSIAQKYSLDMAKDFE